MADPPDRLWNQHMPARRPWTGPEGQGGAAAAHRVTTRVFKYQHRVRDLDEVPLRRALLLRQVPQQLDIAINTAVAAQ